MNGSIDFQTYRMGTLRFRSGLSALGIEVKKSLNLSKIQKGLIGGSRGVAKFVEERDGKLNKVLMANLRTPPQILQHL